MQLNVYIKETLFLFWSDYIPFTCKRCQEVLFALKQFFHTGHRVRWRRIISVSIITLMLIAIVGTLFFLWPSFATAEAQQELTSSPTVEVINTSEHILFQPETEKETGFIFYPGARVDPVAYTRYMKPLAEAGFLSIIVKMPVNLAIFGQNNAQKVIDEYPTIRTWIIGGHSLGGVMACRFAADHPEQIQGLLLYASYCETNLAERTNFIATTLYATNDTLSTPDEILAAKHFLPRTATYTPIEGSIHSFFGDYGPQRGDGNATISHENARQQIIAASLTVLEEMETFYLKN